MISGTNLKILILTNMIICMVLVVISGCASVSEGAPLPKNIPVHRIVIVAGDNITVTVYDEPDLNGTFAVKEDGTITYPLLGVVKVAGLTRGDLEIKLVELLKDGYLVNPGVIVGIVPKKKEIK